MDHSASTGDSTAIKVRKAGGLVSRPLGGGRQSYSTTDIPKAALDIQSERRSSVYTGQRIHEGGVPDSPTSSSSESGLNGDIVTDGRSIPVRLEKIPGNLGRKHYMLNVEGDIREILLELERERRSQLASGRKVHRRKRFSDVSCLIQFVQFIAEWSDTNSWYSLNNSRHLTDSTPSLLSPRSMAFIPSSGWAQQVLVTLYRANHFCCFRLGVSIMMIQIAANSYRSTGSIFGHDITDIMFHPVNFLDCMFMDFIMCFSTMAWCVTLQKAIARGYIRWGFSGWALQSVCGCLKRFH